MEEKATIKIDLEHIKYVFQDCNINFLIGSGLSTPFFGTLGRIEEWLTSLDEKKKEFSNEKVFDFIKASLYNAYYEVSMNGNFSILDFDGQVEKYVDLSEDGSDKNKLKNTYLSYATFFKIVNSILYERRSNTVNKQANIFTSNIDIFIEKVFEDLDLQFNDGFNGVFNKKFSLSNFKKSLYQKSQHYDNISEIPVFNLMKIHGSLTWEMDKIIYFSNLKPLKAVQDCINKEAKFIDINTLNAKSKNEQDRDLAIDEIIEASRPFQDELPDMSELLKAYEKLQIVNPTKEKFSDTTFNKTYYELLRLYANELEKENTALFVLGFSMADEHIREITIRAIKSNPTLKVFIVPYWQNAVDIKENFLRDNESIDNFNNVTFINPIDRFDLKEFNTQILEPILREIKRDYFKKPM